ncbi:MAG: hypothetical protein ACOVOX_05350 [Burkholderiaceae bacterium]
MSLFRDDLLAQILIFWRVSSAAGGESSGRAVGPLDFYSGGARLERLG